MKRNKIEQQNRTKGGKKNANLYFTPLFLNGLKKFKVKRARLFSLDLCKPFTVDIKAIAPNFLFFRRKSYLVRSA